MKKAILWTLLLVLAMVSCQKADIDEGPQPQGAKGNVTFRISQFEQLPFDESDITRATNIADVCTRINLAIYQGTTRVKQVNQKSSDSGFGRVSVDLEEGTYRVVLLAHSCADNPTMTNVEKITFRGDLTDTFWWTGEINVGEDGMTRDITMSRVVAKFRLITTDNVPDEVSTMRFYYTGGSSTLNGLTGWGNAASRQTVDIDVPAASRRMPGDFSVYTFPNEGKDLKMQVTAFTASSTTVAQHTFDNVPVRRNLVTRYRGAFFGTSQGGDDKPTDGQTFTLITNDDWEQIDKAY